MAYATQSDVSALLPAIQAGGTWYAPLTTAQVDAIGTGINAEIDATLAGCGYSTPVASPSGAVDYLTAVHSWGWAASIQRARFRDVNAANTEGAWKFWQEKYSTALKGLCAWASGALGESSGLLPQSYTTMYPTTPATADDIGSNAVPTLTTESMVW